MEKEALFLHIRSMIVSSTKVPKWMAVSTVKVADLYGVNPIEVEESLNALVDEGRLKREKLQNPPHYEVYLLP
ncbi:hypothetical protein [Fictibacillus terranigra]|uniref:MarR family transcriptional regulator n=1 Tax=Fictibacillus terranigra TaxID=3058424 RepID=A0ABT8E9E6_9BACL|nr:hypothetical protein [Fictibacillus sp. CENA-BCM004]MDN4074510.1 hypothetical protein [Fictibacillus sp. CENA-BCM004]